MDESQLQLTRKTDEPSLTISSARSSLAARGCRDAEALDRRRRHLELCRRAEEAKKWYRLAAEHGVAEAKGALEYFVLKGIK